MAVLFLMFILRVTVHIAVLLIFIIVLLCSVFVCKIVRGTVRLPIMKGEQCRSIYKPNKELLHQKPQRHSI